MRFVFFSNKTSQLEYEFPNSCHLHWICTEKFVFNQGKTEKMLLKFRVFLARYCGIHLRKGEEKTFYSVQILTRKQVYESSI